MTMHLAPRDGKALRAKVLGVFAQHRLYTWGDAFWEAVGGSVEHPSLLKICSIFECGLEPVKCDKHGKVERLKAR